MRPPRYLGVFLRTASLVLAAFVAFAYPGLGQLCRAVPLCDDELGRGASIQKVRWTSPDTGGSALNLDLPRTYVSFNIEPGTGGTTEFVTLATYLPELGPRAARPEKRCQPETKCGPLYGHVDDLDIELRSDYYMGSRQPSAVIGTEYWSSLYPRFRREPDKGSFQHYVEHGGPGTCIRRDLVEGDASVRPELIAIAAATAENYICWPQGSEIFVFKGDSSGPDTVIRCGALFESVRFGPKCTAETNINGWRVMYRFPGSQLGRWREFDAGTRSVVQRLSAGR
jgi:hypothetical protein